MPDHTFLQPCVLRLATIEDAARIRDIYSEYVLNSPASFELDPPSVTEMARRMETVLAAFPWLVSEQDGDLMGYVYASAHSPRPCYRWSADVSVYIAPVHHRKGLGRAMYTALLACLRLQRIYNAYAGITLPNEGSVGLHEAMGFTPVGVYREVGYKFGRWHDVGWWEMELLPHRDSPEEPILLPEAVKLAGWEDAVNVGLARRTVR